MRIRMLLTLAIDSTFVYLVVMVWLVGCDGVARWL
jgi:hypothetical protein